MMKNKRHDAGDQVGDGQDCSRNVHLQVTPSMYSELDAAWKATALRSRNDWIRQAIEAALAAEGKRK